MTVGLIALLRPRQWVKNVLVFAAPFAAGVILQPHVAGQTLLAFVALCLASSATYCLNDVLDAEADALHPIKRRRPIPSGRVSPRVALALGAALAAAALTVAVPGDLRWVVLGYLAVTVAYSIFFKHQPVVELALVSAGFVLRAIAGGAATGVPLSQWFLIVTGFGSLFMVTGKRLSEMLWAEPRALVRTTLTHYAPSYLRTVLGISAAVTITGYCLWASEVATHSRHPVWIGLSVFPFVIAILRYALDTDHGRVEEPEEVVLRDPALLSLGLLWLVTYAVGVLL